MQRIFPRRMAENSFRMKRIQKLICHIERYNKGEVERTLRNILLSHVDAGLVVTALVRWLVVRGGIGIMMPMVGVALVFCTRNRFLFHRLMLVVGATPERGMRGHEGGD